MCITWSFSWILQNWKQSFTNLALRQSSQNKISVLSRLSEINKRVSRKSGRAWALCAMYASVKGHACGDESSIAVCFLIEPGNLTAFKPDILQIAPTAGPWRVWLMAPYSRWMISVSTDYKSPVSLRFSLFRIIPILTLSGLSYLLQSVLSL